MIRVYSANFTKEDYKKLAEIFNHGLSKVAPIEGCEIMNGCERCENCRVCTAILNAIDYCDRQAEQMVES